VCVCVCVRFVIGKNIIIAGRRLQNNTHPPQVEPSQRNAAVGADCVFPYPTIPGNGCSNITWDPLNPVPCSGKDATGTTYEGICGVDNRCYHSDVGFDGTKKAFLDLKTQFLAKDAINNFDAFNDLRNPTAVVAYAKGALVYLSILQELHLLGSPTAEDQVARAFANRAANWLQSRVDYHTNMSVAMVTVLDANDANTYKSEPLAMRKSCKPGDVDQNQWYGISKLDSSSYNKDTTFVRGVDMYGYCFTAHPPSTTVPHEPQLPGHLAPAVPGHGHLQHGRPAAQRRVAKQHAQHHVPRQPG